MRRFRLQILENENQKVLMFHFRKSYQNHCVHVNSRGGYNISLTGLTMSFLKKI